MKCESCGGLGYKEHEAGLIRLLCRECEGTGEEATTFGVGHPSRPLGTEYSDIPGYIRTENDDKPKALILSEQMGHGETLEELTVKAKEIIANDSINGGRATHSGARDSDTSQPKRTRKSKARKKAAKRAS